MSDPATDAMTSTKGILDTVLGGTNPIGMMANILGPALAGAPSSASGASDSGSPVIFGSSVIGGGTATSNATTGAESQSPSAQATATPVTTTLPGLSTSPLGIAPGQMLTGQAMQSTGAVASKISPVMLAGGAALALGIVYAVLR